MKKSEVYYNYFEDVNPDYEDSDFLLKNRLDPDKVSATLYDALYKMFFYNYRVMCSYGIKKAIIIGQKFSDDLFYTIFINDDEFLLSSDYIGTSINQAKAIGKYEDFEIKNFLRLSRTLGGHMLWSRNVSREDTNKRWVSLYYDYGKYKKKEYFEIIYKSLKEIEEFKIDKEKTHCLKNGKWKENKLTINTRRGGDAGVYDRFDWTLLLLKTYYSWIKSEECNKGSEGLDKFIAKAIESYRGLVSFDKEDLSVLKTRLGNIYFALDNSREWLLKFKTFKSFCDYFLLNGSFVDDKYEVIELTSFFPIKPVNYKEYVENNIRAINKRNQQML